MVTTEHRDLVERTATANFLVGLSPLRVYTGASIDVT